MPLPDGPTIGDERALRDREVDVAEHRQPVLPAAIFLGQITGDEHEEREEGSGKREAGTAAAALLLTAAAAGVFEAQRRGARQRFSALPLHLENLAPRRRPLPARRSASREDRPVRGTSLTAGLGLDAGQRLSDAHPAEDRLGGASRSTS